MVFHITNYMRETNVWMIRKMRWIFWGAVGSIPIYRNTYWVIKILKLKCFVGLLRKESSLEELVVWSHGGN